MDYQLEKNDLAPFLPRLGMAITLIDRYEQLSYYGNGPYSSYSDKGVATYLDYFNPMHGWGVIKCMEFRGYTVKPQSRD